MGVVIAYSTDNISFILGYLTYMMPLFALSTFSYDEFDNGNAFLFTLPVSRKGYVIEKYCFSLLLGIASWMLAIVLSLAIGAMKDFDSALEIVKVSPIIFGTMLLLLSIMIPLQIKFGTEKSRVAILIVGGLIVLVVFGAAKLCKLLKIDLEALANKVFQMSSGIVIAAAVMAVLLVVWGSMNISTRIMNKKEF